MSSIFLVIFAAMALGMSQSGCDLPSTYSIRENNFPSPTPTGPPSCPSVVIASPMEHAIVSGEVPIPAVVTGVWTGSKLDGSDIYIDGRWTMFESDFSADTQTFYWPSTLDTNGTHIIQARAAIGTVTGTYYFDGNTYYSTTTDYYWSVPDTVILRN